MDEKEGEGIIPCNITFEHPMAVPKVQRTKRVRMRMRQLGIYFFLK
jgi:hypothetical protein